MTPSIINTNNRNLNIKYNERLVKDIRKDEREKTLKDVVFIIDLYIGATEYDLKHECDDEQQKLMSLYLLKELTSLKDDLFKKLGEKK